MRFGMLAVCLALLLGVPPVFSAPAQEVTFTSSQLTPVEEQEWARNTLLKPFEDESGIRVQFVADTPGPVIDRLLAEPAPPDGHPAEIAGPRGSRRQTCPGLNW